MFALFAVALLISSALAHDGTCPEGQEEAAAVAEKVTLVKTVPLDVKTFVTGQKFVTKEIFDPSLHAKTGAVIGHSTHIFGQRIHDVPTRVKVVSVVKNIPASEEKVVSVSKTVPAFEEKVVSVVKPVVEEKVFTNVIEAKTLPVAPVEQTIVKEIDPPVIPVVKTIPTESKTFITGQKVLNKDVDTFVEVPVGPSFNVEGHKVIKVVHVSKQEEFIPHRSAEAIYLGLASGVDALFPGSKIDVSFSCHGKKYGYYADVRNLCKIYHVCREVGLPDGSFWMQRSSFSCPLGSVFDQQKLICVGEKDAMDCSQSELFYEHTAKTFAGHHDKKGSLQLITREAPVKTCCVYPTCAYVFPCALK